MRTTNIVNHKQHSKENIPNHIDSTQLTINPEGMQHIMSLLTNLYKNSALAIFREYIANAYDSQIKAGTLGLKQIEVTITSPENKLYKKFDGTKIVDKGLFSVKDYGIGMSHEDMLNIYSKYGSTTKNNDNDTIGGFGVGAKSALSITDYFEVTSIKDGIKTVSAIQVDVTKKANLYILASEKTHEPNGVEIRIPVSEKISLEILNESAQFFYAWETNIITVNGQEPFWAGYLNNSERFLALKNSLDDTVGWLQFLSTQHYEEKHLPPRGKLKANRYSPNTQQPLAKYNLPSVFIGGIPYYIDENMLKDTKIAIYTHLKKCGYSLHLNAPIGSLTLTPDRESIQAGEENREVIKTLLETALSLIQPSLFNHLQSLPKKEAYTFYYWNIAGLHPDVVFPSWNAEILKHQKGNMVDDYNKIPETHHHGEAIPKTLNLANFFEPTTKATVFFSNNDSDFSNKTFLLNQELYWLSFVTKSEPFKSYYRPNRFFSENHFTYMNVFVYGKYTGQSKKPISSYLTTALKAEGYAPTNFWNIIQVDSDVLPPEIIRSSIPTYEINDIEKIAKAARKKAADEKRLLAGANGGGKTRSSSIYPVGSYNPATGFMEIEMLTRKEYSTLDKEIILYQEYDILEEPLNVNGRHTSSVTVWAEEFKKISLNKAKRPEGFQLLDKFSEVWSGSYIALSLSSRKPEALINANAKTRMLKAKLNSYYLMQDKATRKKLTVMYLILTNSLNRHFLHQGDWKNLTDPYLYSVYKELSDNVSNESTTSRLMQRYNFHSGIPVNPEHHNSEFPTVKNLSKLSRVLGSNYAANTLVTTQHYNKLLELKEFQI